MTIADDIQKARDAGHSDQDILTAIQKFSPQYGSDIDTALKANHSPSDVVNALQKFDQASTAAAQPTGIAGVFKSVTDPLRYGLSNAAEGYQSTAKATGNDGVASDAMGSVSQAVAPSDYTPAHVTLNPRTWGDIPKALGEAVPAIAPDIAAGEAGAATGGLVGSVVPGVGTGIGAVAGGVLGATASYGLRNYGDLLRRAVAGSSGNPDGDPSVSDKARALAAVAAGGLLSRVGFKGATGVPARAAEGSVLSQVVPQVAKGAAIDAATGAGSEATTEGLVDQKLDPNAIGGAAVTGAATGAAIKGVSSIKDFKAEKQFAGLTPEEALPVAQRLAAVHGDAYRGTAKEDGAAIAKVQDDLGVRAKSLASDSNVTGHIKSLQEADQADTTRETLGRVQADIAAGRTPAAEDMKALSDTLGQFPHGSDLVDTLGQQATLNKIISLGNYDKNAGTFSGGLSSSKFAQHALNPFGKLAVMADLGAGVLGASGHTLPGMSAMHGLGVDPMSALAIPAAQIGTYGALRGIDALTGARSPVSQFVNRFSDPNTPNPFGSRPTAPVVPPAGGPAGVPAGDPTAAPSGPRAPAFNDVLAQAKADAQAKALADKAPDPVDIQLKQIKATAALMKNSDTLEAQRQKAIAAQAKQEAAPVAALDAQRSKAFVAEQRAQAAAARTLDAQRSSAFVHDQNAQAASTKALDAQRSGAFVRNQLDAQRAVASLEKQRAAAQQGQVVADAKANEPLARARATSRLMANSEQGPSTPAGPILGLARLKQQYAKAAEKAAGAPDGPQATPVSNGSPAAPQGTPQAIPAAPQVVTIHHQDGTRHQVVDDIRHKLSSVQNGVATKADARRAIVTDAQQLPLSPTGRSRLQADLDSPTGLLKQVFHSKNKAAARGTVEDELDHFSPADAATIRNHLKNHIDPSTGHTFYSTWE